MVSRMPEQIDLWPADLMPGYCADPDQAESLVPNIQWWPANTVDADETQRTNQSERPTVLIIPGGGYHMRADERAGRIAQWCNEVGFHAATLQYRVNPWRYPAPQQDAIRAVRLFASR